MFSDFRASVDSHLSPFFHRQGTSKSSATRAKACVTWCHRCAPSPCPSAFWREVDWKGSVAPRSRISHWFSRCATKNPIIILVLLLLVLLLLLWHIIIIMNMNMLLSHNKESHDWQDLILQLRMWQWPCHAGDGSHQLLGWNMELTSKHMGETTQKRWNNAGLSNKKCDWTGI